MKILILKQDEMLKVFSMSEAIQACREAFELYSDGKTDIPLRVNIDVPQASGQSLYMPGYACDAGALGVKIVSVYPGNPAKGLPSVPAVMALLDAQTGMLISLMDGTCLTRIRTGAASGVATDILSSPESSIFALFGAGGQAETQLEATLTVRPAIKEVRVFSLQGVEEFVQRMRNRFEAKFNCKIKAVSSPAEAVHNADIITTVTTSKTPVYDGKLLKRGVHVNGVGSYTPEMHENDEYFVTRAKVYVDTRDGAFAEAADLIIPVQNHTFSFDQVVGEIGEVIAGKAPGRVDAEENTFFKTVGSGVQDIVTARRIYDKAVKLNIGSFIDF
ncbi:MAG: ornithine cyclodeaminase family protein [Deltaproteobacteria bacterium]|jgi:ornithine cyclodeaminase|nr:ornithine cyclodeaminase family protein [Deltaproteobacteria bacterium]